MLKGLFSWAAPWRPEIPEQGTAAPGRLQSSGVRWLFSRKIIMNFRPLGQMESRSMPGRASASGSSGAGDASRFSIQQGRAVRAGLPGLWSGIRRMAGASVGMSAGRVSPPARGRREAANRGPDRKELVRIVLDRMAPAAFDAEARSSVVRALVRLGEASRGDLDTLPGARELLTDYLDQMAYPYLASLREGLLGHTAARHALIGRIPDGSRAQALGVLNQLTQALDEKLARETVGEPLTQLARMLSRMAWGLTGAQARGYGEGLRLHLLSLYRRLSVGDVHRAGERASVAGMLDIYLESLDSEAARRLLFELRPEKLDAVRAILLHMFGNPAPRVECRLPCFIMLTRLRMSLTRAVQARARPELLALQQELGQARGAQSRRAASRVLRGLHALLNRTRQIHAPLPGELAEEARRLANDSADLLRDARSNPAGPLTASSLEALDDHTLNHLCQISSLLEPSGLELDLEAVRTVGLQRVEALSLQVVEGLKAVVRMLISEPLDLSLLLRRFADLSGLELRRIRQLEESGRFGADGPGSADFRSLARTMCRRALDELVHEGHAHLVDGALPYSHLFRKVANRYIATAAELNAAIAQGDYAEGGRAVRKHLLANYHLLEGMSDVMFLRNLELAQSDLADSTGGRDAPLAPSTEPTVGMLPDIFYSILREQYGVDYDPGRQTVSLLVTDSLRASMMPALEERPLASASLAVPVMLPVDGTQTEFWLSEGFRDGLESRSLYLSVRGAWADGQPVRYTWPARASHGEYVHDMGKALDVLGKVAGAQAGALMRLMQHEHIYRAVTQGLRRMGMDSPFKLPDGTVVQVEGRASFGFDVAQTEDGDFLIAATVKYHDLAVVPGTSPDGTDVTITMNPWTSWAEIQYALLVSADAREVKTAELPQFRHHFDDAQIAVDNALNLRSQAVHPLSMFD